MYLRLCACTLYYIWTTSSYRMLAFFFLHLNHEYWGIMCRRWDFIEEGSKFYKDMDRLVAFEKGLNTWAKWVDLHVEPTKTKVVFQGVSPDHAK